MKLAEALALRADLSARLAQLAARAEQNVLFQEGEEPAEDATALLAEHELLAAQLEELMLRINETNLSVRVGEISMTAALAKRDVLRMRVRLLQSVAAAASERGGRTMRSELRLVSAVSVPELRAEADRGSARLRELDTAVQEANWTNSLVTELERR